MQSRRVDELASYHDVSSTKACFRSTPLPHNMNFNGFLAHLDEALSNEDGVKLSYLLRPSSPHGKELLKEIRNPTVRRILF
jgi:hypothetical protein